MVGDDQKQGLKKITRAYNPCTSIGGLMANNPRYKNGTLRRKYRARFKAMNAPCGICKGKLGEIHYDEPSDAKHPLSFVIDEIFPVSRYKEFGYQSREDCAKDFNNLQAAHYVCNQTKGAKTLAELANNRRMIKRNGFVNDGEW